MSGETEWKDCPVIVVSSRLPYQITAENHGQTGKKLEPSVSGLVTAMKDSLPRDALWLGVINEKELADFQELLEKLKKENETETTELRPVPISKELNEKHRKWCNGKFWPIFHGMQEEVDEDAGEDCWKSYKEVNEKFADAIAKELSEVTTKKVWIHDYHFFLVPKLLREIADKQNLLCRIGFFLHIPFPTEEMLKGLPNFKEILKGMLGSDSIGFHTTEYRLNFLQCFQKHMKRTTKADNSNELQFQGRKVFVQTVPAGIEYSTFAKQSEGQLSEVLKKFPENLKKLVDDFIKDPNKIFMIGVERIDYTKGLLQKVEAFKTLLKDHPEHEIFYLQIAVPCRENEPKYKKLRKEFEEKVQTESLKGNQSKIHVSYDKVSQQDLSVLYKRADVALVTPLIDGLNLVALEYIACQKEDDPGVLILSKNTGAAKYLDDAIQVDPKDGMADDMHRAIIMSQEKRRQKMDKLQNQVKKHLGAKRWVRQSLDSLKEHVEKKSKL